MDKLSKARSHTRSSLRSRQGGWWGAIAGLAGDFIAKAGQDNANDQNSAEAAANRNFNAFEAQRDRDFQERMRDTSVQARAADMKKAGINPILAAGNPAAQPGGAQATGQNAAAMQNPNSAFSALGSQVNNAMTTSAQVANTNADTEQKNVQTEGIHIANENAKLTAGEIVARTGAQSASAQQASAAAEAAHAQADVARKTLDQLEQSIKESKSRQGGLEISNKTQQLLQQAQVDKAKAEAKLASLGIPKAQVEADLSKKSQMILGTGDNSWTAKSGEWIATHSHDIVDALNEWWTALKHRAPVQGYKGPQ